jgi:hypothetical protein
VLLSMAEQHSNVVPWLLARRQAGAGVKLCHSCRTATSIWTRSS